MPVLKESVYEDAKMVNLPAKPNSIWNARWRIINCTLRTQPAKKTITCLKHSQFGLLLSQQKEPHTQQGPGSYWHWLLHKLLTLKGSGVHVTIQDAQSFCIISFWLYDIASRFSTTYSKRGIRLKIESYVTTVTTYMCYAFESISFTRGQSSLGFIVHLFYVPVRMMQMINEQHHFWRF